MDPFIGEIRPLAFKFVPMGWSSCDGQQQQISQNPALYAILGTVFGGDGTTTFNLPDLRNRAPMGAGSGSGLMPRALGCTVGATSVTLSASNFPAHTHAVQVNSGNASSQSAAAAYLANSISGSSSRPAPSPSYAPATTTLASLASGTVSVAGSGTTSQSRTTVQPYLTIQLCIALWGVYPVRP